MLIDFVGCYVFEIGCKYLFADLEPKPLVKRGAERRVKRRQEEERLKQEQALVEARASIEKKAQ
jgi:cation-transporting ATPase 13A1